MAYTEVTLTKELFDRAVAQGREDFLCQPADSHGFKGDGERIRISGMIGETAVVQLARMLLPEEQIPWPFDVPFEDRFHRHDMVLKGRILEIKITNAQYSWARHDRGLQTRIDHDVIMVFVRSGFKDYTYRVSMIPIREIIEKGHIDYKGRPDRPPLHVIEQYDLVERPFLEILNWT